MKSVVLAWSSGKDSAMALYQLKRDPTCQVRGLFTTYRETDERVGIHEVPIQNVEDQARALGLPLLKIPLPVTCPNTVYEARMQEALSGYPGEPFTHLAFGDLFLEDIRRFRETQLKNLGLLPLFPLWGKDTRALANEMIQIGIRAVLTAVDRTVLPKKWIGHAFNAAFLSALPTEVDPCGENGEFHTFVYDSPDFSHPISFSPSA